MGSGAGAGAAGAKLLVYAMGDTGTGTGIGTGAGTGADARGCAGSGGSSVNEGSVAGRGMRCNAPIMMSHPSLCVCVCGETGEMKSDDEKGLEKQTTQDRSRGLE